MNRYEHGGRIYDKQIRLDFSANINPYGMPESVKQAICNGINHYHLYPDNDAVELKKAISEAEQMEENDIICGNGASDLIYRLCYSIHPKKACVLAPTFSEYEKALHAVDCKVEYVQLKEEQQFCFMEEEFEQKSRDCDLFFLCNPNNPVGNVIPPWQLKRILDICCKNQTFLVIDECFLDFMEEHERYSGKQFMENPIYQKHFFVLKAFTKLYGMAGIRLGYGICKDETVLSAMEFHGPTWNVSTPAQRAGIVALSETDFVNKTRKTIANERNFLVEQLKSCGFTVYSSEVNYLLFKAPRGLEQYALSKEILIRSCANYEGLDEEYYRIAVKLHKENVELVKCFKDFCNLE